MKNVKTWTVNKTESFGGQYICESIFNQTNIHWQEDSIPYPSVCWENSDKLTLLSTTLKSVNWSKHLRKNWLLSSVDPMIFLVHF